MSDPVVCSFITKILCSKGGRLDRNELPQHVGLGEQQLSQILGDMGPERFLMHKQGGTTWVLALSSVRLCVRKECRGCDGLHLCKLNLMGKCKARACKYSHDIFSENNRMVLKKHEISGLNEQELRVLLLQNDPFLLPVCNFYNKGDGSCSQEDNCPRLHICQYFLKGQCRFPHCKRCHDLLQPNIVRQLNAEGVDDTLAWNIQTICDHRNALSRQLGPRKGNASNTGPAVSAETSNAGIQKEKRQEQTSRILSSNHDAKPTPSAKPLNAEKDKIDEICLFYVWQFCKNKSNCKMIHYDMPYRWQIQTENGWKDLAKREEIETAYCDPNITRLLDPDINFKSMTSGLSQVRRLSTPSSVTKPAKFVMTTKWLWYWQNEFGQCIEYGKQVKNESSGMDFIAWNENGQLQGSNLNSDDLENLFLADPSSTVQFTAGSQHYEISFKDMIQRNLRYHTKREVRRRPKFVSSEDVKSKKGHMGNASASTSASVPASNYPSAWDKSALPAVGYRAIELSKTSAEYRQIESLFQKTMNHYVIEKIKRIQNPSLWQVFQWQKEQMKKKRGGQNVGERLLFHGTSMPNMEAICSDNFDWRICGTNGTVYGKGSYFARDAQYSHSYCQRDAKMKIMFVAQVLVGDFITGNAAYTRPPAKSSNMVNCYDSCVNNMIDPSIFVIFEKHQIYPSYIIYYCEENKKCVLS